MTPFDVEIWGTVGQWFSGTATSGALGLGFYVMLRDRRKEERTQASQVTCWIEPTGPVLDDDGDAIYPSLVHVVDHSERPVYNLAFRVHLPDGKDYERRKLHTPGIGKPSYTTDEWVKRTGKLGYFANSTQRVVDDANTRILKASDEVIGDYQSPISGRYYSAIVEFTDASGVTWSRDVSLSKIRKKGRDSVIYYKEGLIPKRRILERLSIWGRV